jgi:hypothetical protein
VSLASKFAKGTKQNCFYKKKINDVKVSIMSFFYLFVLVAKLIVIFFHLGNVFRGGEGGSGWGG